MKRVIMRTTLKTSDLCLIAALLLVGCGVESAATAAASAKLQAEQLKQGQTQIEDVKKKLAETEKASAEQRRQAEAAQ